MVSELFLRSGALRNGGITAFADPRSGTERRVHWSPARKRKGEQRSRIVDRRVYCREYALKPWWLLRSYVTAEKFVDRAESCGSGPTRY